MHKYVSIQSHWIYNAYTPIEDEVYKHGNCVQTLCLPSKIVYHDKSLPLLLSLFKWDANLVHSYQLAKLTTLTLKYASSMLHINRNRLSHPQQNSTLLWSPVFNELAPTITHNISICHTNAEPITFPFLPGIKIVHYVLCSSLSLCYCHQTSLMWAPQSSDSALLGFDNASAQTLSKPPLERGWATSTLVTVDALQLLNHINSFFFSFILEFDLFAFPKCAYYSLFDKSSFLVDR